MFLIENGVVSLTTTKSKNQVKNWTSLNFVIYWRDEDNNKQMRQ